MADQSKYAQDSPDSLIDILSHRPEHVMDTMIRVGKRIKSTGPRGTSEFISLGHLDILPIELLHSVLKLLDFRNLSNFRRVSQGGNAIVKSLPAYHDLISHAPRALIALSRTKLILSHSAASVHAEFLSENCRFCQNYGPFLFLPTCERYCYYCLYSNQSLWVISRQLASLLAGVSLKKINRIPAMLRIPVTRPRRNASRRLNAYVSVKQAEELGIAVHGSREAMNNYVEANKAGKVMHYQRQRVERFAVPVAGEEIVHKNFQGWTSIAFPSRGRNNSLENGFWCLGCRIAYDNSESKPHGQSCRSHWLHRNTLEKLALQARSKPQFVEHLRNCQAAKELLGNDADGLTPVR